MENGSRAVAQSARLRLWPPAQQPLAGGAGPRVASSLHTSGRMALAGFLKTRCLVGLQCFFLMQRCQTDQRRCHWKRYKGDERAAEQVCDGQAADLQKCVSSAHPLPVTGQFIVKMYIYIFKFSLGSGINRKALNHFKEETF